MWVVLKQTDRVVWGEIVEIKPDLLVIRPSDTAALDTGSDVTMAGIAFGQVPTHVVGNRNGHILVRRPPSVQLWFRSRRSHRRLPLELPVSLELDGALAISGMTEDVSLGGALLLVPPAPGMLASGAEGRLIMEAKDHTIVAECALRFSSDAGTMRHLGIQFRTMEARHRTLLVSCLEELLAGFERGIQ
jgi:c-di-GMP-binding flagellar brake protein YcgR